MAREYLMAVCGGSLMVATWAGFGWFITPETPEFKLARIRAGLSLSIPIRPLPPDTKIIKCVMMWVGGLEGDAEIWCPPVRPKEQAPPAVPTS